MRIGDITHAVAREGRVVLAMVARARGSAPREAGAALLVWPGGASGTVGGGAVEHRTLAICRDMLAADAPAPAEIDFPLGPALDQCCGGHMRLAFAPLSAADLPRLRAARGRLELLPGGPAFQEPAPARPVLVYGAGHVGRALIRALAPLPFRLHWIDARMEMFADAPPGVETLATPLPEAVAATAPPDALHLVLTHSHALDLEIVSAVLARGEFGFLGLIGSASKKALFRRRLAERGIGSERMTCPIGLPGLRDKRPEVIAAAAAAQLLQVDAKLAAAGLGVSGEIVGR